MNAPEFHVIGNRTIDSITVAALKDGAKRTDCHDIAAIRTVDIIQRHQPAARVQFAPQCSVPSQDRAVRPDKITAIGRRHP
jgi:hypothetical protein